MRKKFLLIAALLLIPTLAWAGMNIQQKSHGGAVWVQTFDGTSVPAGDTGIVVEMTNLAAAATKYVMVPKTGYITKVYSVLQEAIATGNAAITIETNRYVALQNVFDQFTPTGHSLTITASGSRAGDLDSSTAAPSTATRVQQGDVIAIVGDGGPVGNGGAIFTIIIE